ncbi:hypothetical protein [Ralstonia holmesii]|uniref:hypothetical protein n=1 Tax=Ralstonia holmesii TaxID=3058602 RepID=UPI003D64B825
MRPSDQSEFVKLLNLCYSTLLRPLPTFEAIDLWQTILEPYSIEQVRVALSAHMRESKFPPMPADVVARMPKASDVRPEVDEAWAIAIRAADESETVVWTTEIAEAWHVAQPVFHGDEIGARMAFKAAYARIVERNRGVNAAPEWVVSQGHDSGRRKEVLAQAVREGRLQLEQAKSAVPLLAGPGGKEDEPTADAKAVENLQRIKDMLKAGSASADRRQAERERRARETADQMAEVKRETARQVEEHTGGSASLRPARAWRYCCLCESHGERVEATCTQGGYDFCEKHRPAERQTPRRVAAYQGARA